MKVSLNLVKHIHATYGSGVDPYSLGVDEIVARIGAQLGAVEDVIYTGTKYEGVIVARVVSFEQHPDADKLKICRIDDAGRVEHVERGDDGLVQVVCGASNVVEGMFVAWLPPGSTVPSTHDTDPFVLTPKELRGVLSNGMLASPRELAIGDDHMGILSINPDDVGQDLAQPGTELKELYGLDDVIIDCENKMFTHRPDCFGVMGVGREILGIFGESFTSPDWYTTPLSHEPTDQLPLTVYNEVTTAVPRFTVQVMSSVSVAPSPMWLQVLLSNMGQKSINNIVDYTNFFMIETGQPLHAFDYDKVAALSSGEPTLQPRMAKKGEHIALLNGKTIELTEDDIVIATDSTPVALAGVMGGSATEVDETTQNIVIECANFDMYTIRRTSMRHGLFTDAVTRFNKGQSPLQNEAVIARMVQEVKTYAGGMVASQLHDIAGFDMRADNLSRVETTSDFINARLGTSLTGLEIKTLLDNVEFVVGIDDLSHSDNKTQNSKLIITAPFWRMDVAIPEDIVEEVGRLHGYDRVPVVLPLRSSKPPHTNQARMFKQSVRSMLTDAGAHEVLTYSFVHGDTMRAVGVDPDKWAYHVRNALSPDLQYYRTALLPSLLAKVHGNSKAGAGDDTNEFALFEFGSAHVKDHMDEAETRLPKQMPRLAGVIAADQKTAKKYAPGDPYYQAKRFVDMITEGQATYKPLENTEFPLTAAFQKGRSATVQIGEQVLGVVGEFHTKAKKSFKLLDFSAGFEIDIELLRQHMKGRKYVSLSTFPSTTQDMTFEVASELSWAKLHRFIHAEIAVAAAEDHYLYTIEPLDIYQPEDTAAKRISFRIELSHRLKTLTTDEVTTILDHVAAAATQSINATRI